MLGATVLSVLSRGYMSIAKFVAIVLIARALGAEGQGAFSVALNTGALGAMIGSAGLEIANSYFAGQNENSRAALVSHSLALTATVGVVLGLVIGQLSASTYIFGDLSIGYAWLVAASVPLQMAFILLSGITIGLARFRLQLASYFVLYSLYLGGAAAVIVLPSWEYLPFVVWAIANAVASVVLVVRILPGSTMRRFDLVLLRHQLRFGLGAYVSNLANWLNFRLDLLLVAALLGIREAGLYAVAAALAEGLLQLPKAIGGPLLASSARNGGQSGSSDFVIYRVSTALIAFACLVGIVAAPWLVTALFTSTYLPSVPALRLLLLATLAMSISTLASNHLYGLGQATVPARASLAALTVTVLLDLVAIPKFGIEGAAMVSIVAYATSSVVMSSRLIELYRHAGIGWRDLILLTRADVALLTAGFMRRRSGAAAGGKNEGIA